MHQFRVGSAATPFPRLHFHQHIRQMSSYVPARGILHDRLLTAGINTGIASTTGGERRRHNRRRRTPSLLRTLPAAQVSGTGISLTAALTQAHAGGAQIASNAPTQKSLQRRQWRPIGQQQVQLVRVPLETNLSSA